jgi:endo-1,4-beta-xylanase
VSGTAGAGNGGLGGAGAAGAPTAGQGGGAGHGGTSAGGAAGAGGLNQGGTGVTETAPPVGKKFVGNIDTYGRMRPDFVKYWNQFSPENAGKWASIERTRGEMNWTTLDGMYDYAKQRKIVFKQHNLIWGTQQPSWLNNLSQAEQRAEVEEWIKAFCERYPDVPIIDVVNEPPPHTTPPYVAALGGAGSSGYDWIAQAFKWAHQYCPNSILILNDYNNIEYSSDNAHTIDIVNKIKAAGATIHAVGAQAHDAYKMSTGSVQQYIDKIAHDTGLPVYISEYDIDLGDDNQQKSVMQSQFTMFYTNENVKGVTLWGYISGMTWKPNTGLMSSSGTPRPALTWLLDYLSIPK